MIEHLPVMLREVIENINLGQNKVVFDCTFGAGGYSAAILDHGANKVIGIDRDPSTKKYADLLIKKYGERFEFICSNFSNIDDIAKKYGRADAIIYDFGVSSMQLDQAERGFSFSKNAKLDMRMSASGKSAYDIVNSYAEEELADIIFNYGGERASRRIAKKICESRAEKPIDTTFELANIVRSIVPKTGKIDPSTKTFQGIRIAVNDELSAIERSLANLKSSLNIGARVVTVSFHELEDRIIKQFFIENSEPKVAISKYKEKIIDESKIFRLVNKKSIKPSRDEILSNPRARSARLRVAERVR